MKLALLSTLAVFAVSALATSNQTITGIDGRERTFEEAAAIQDDADTNRRCHQSNGNYIPALKAGEYVSNAFHNCFRTSTQIYEFVDAIVAQNPSLLTKFAISKTYKGATIYGYKLSKGGKSQSLYFQAMQHSREWVAGSSILYSFSAILDEITSGKPTAADTFDLYFVPIVNIDGYEITWNGNRYQRKSGHEVDLNRNWPTPYKNPYPPSQSSETYPGTKPFSEPETAGINSWLQSKRSEIAGFIDIHTYAGLILYAYGDTKQPIGNGYDEKFDALGRGLQNVMGAYKPQHAYQLYLAYGVFPDYAFREFNKPAITIEIVGNDFVAPASTIRTRGLEIYKGVNQFAKEVLIFNGSGPSPSTVTPTTATPTSKPTTPKPTTPKPRTSRPTTTRRRPRPRDQDVEDEEYLQIPYLVDSEKELID